MDNEIDISGFFPIPFSIYGHHLRVTIQNEDILDNGETIINNIYLTYFVIDDCEVEHEIETMEYSEFLDNLRNKNEDKLLKFVVKKVDEIEENHNDFLWEFDERLIKIANQEKQNDINDYNSLVWDNLKG